MLFPEYIHESQPMVPSANAISFLLSGTLFDFVVSSTIRFWDLHKSFPELNAVNRGFGGSQLADSVYFAPRIVLKYEPRTVVLYAGDNDLAAGKTPDQVAADFRAFTRLILAR